MKKILLVAFMLMCVPPLAHAELLSPDQCLFSLFGRVYSDNIRYSDDVYALCNEVSSEFGWTTAQRNDCADILEFYISWLPDYDDWRDAIGEIDDVSSICDRCPQGWIADESGCDPCGSGYTTSAEYAGYRPLVASRNRCDPCSPGETTVEDSDSVAIVCAPCEPGQYSDTEGATECEFCPSGYYANGYGNTSCEKCPDYNGIQAKTDCSSSMDGADCDNISACYVPATETFTNEIGTWRFRNGCRYGAADDEY